MLLLIKIVVYYMITKKIIDSIAGCKCVAEQMWYLSVATLSSVVLFVHDEYDYGCL